MGKKNNLGRAIIKDRFKSGRRNRGGSHLHTTELEDGFDWNRLNLKSVTEENTLDEFLSKAELAGTEFTAEKLNVTIVTNFSGVPTADEQQKSREAQETHRKQLKIPRRPAWDSETTPEDLDQRERESFLEWRRDLAQLQEIEGIVMTPYEKNLDFWRQLWRVIERSDIIMQIVDARHPLLFRCEDLETYVNEVDQQKANVILLNKSDFLTHEQRVAWAKYFDSIGVTVAFWSAVEESERLKLEKQSENSEDTLHKAGDDDSEESDDDDDSDRDDDDDDDADDGGDEKEEDDDEDKNSDDAGNRNVDDDDDDDEWEDIDEEPVSEADSDADAIADAISNALHSANTCDRPKNINTIQSANSPEILTGPQLIKLMRSMHRGRKKDSVTTIGLVGYPNVGKSSTINTLLQTKKVPVSATPGRTKHFQTLFLDPSLMLCDCPGLVMPSFVSTKADMVVNGILPIDQMREFVPPVALVCKNIHRDILEATYGIMLPQPSEDEDANRPPTAYELLGAYATVRGFMTHKGIPDFQRAARYILKDYVNGKLLHCVAPPGVDSAIFEPKQTSNKSKKSRCVGDNEENSMAASSLASCPVATSSVDAAFFSQMLPRVGSHGTHGTVGFTRVVGYAGQQHSSEASAANLPMAEASASSSKPWKHHNNAKKREKLRRITAHLDA